MVNLHQRKVATVLQDLLLLVTSLICLTSPTVYTKFIIAIIIIKYAIILFTQTFIIIFVYNVLFNGEIIN